MVSDHSLGHLGSSQATHEIQTNDGFSRTLLTSSAGLENAKQLVTAYKTGKLRDMTPELWKAKKIIDSTIHPGADVQARTSGESAR